MTYLLKKLKNWKRFDFSTLHIYLVFMLKYKNRLTPNVHTLQKFVNFYKTKNSTTNPQALVNSKISSLWVIYNLQSNQPSFKSIFQNINLISNRSWTVKNFKSHLKTFIKRRHTATLTQALLFSKVITQVSKFQDKSLIAPYTKFFNPTWTLIGKPFNPKESYFFTSQFHNPTRPYLNHFFPKTVLKTRFLNSLKYRLLGLNSNSLQSSLQRKGSTKDTFGGPVPFTNKRYLKPYLFTNTSQSETPTTLISFLSGSPLLLFKRSKKKFIQRRFRWSGLVSKKSFDRQEFTHRFRTNVNLFLSNVRTSSFINTNNVHRNLESRLKQNQPLLSTRLITSMQFGSGASIRREEISPLSSVFRTVFYLLRFTQVNKRRPYRFANLFYSYRRLRYINRNQLVRKSSLSWVKKGILRNKVTPKSQVLGGINSLNIFRSNSLTSISQTTTYVQSSLRKGFSQVFKTKLIKRSKFHEKRSKLTFFRVKTPTRRKMIANLTKVRRRDNFFLKNNIKTFLSRPQRWGRKKLRRLSLRRSLNSITLVSNLFKSFPFCRSLRNFTKPFAKSNFSYCNQKFVWRRYVKWKKVKHFRRYSSKRTLFLKKLSRKFLVKLSTQNNNFLNRSPLKWRKRKLTRRLSIRLGNTWFTTFSLGAPSLLPSSSYELCEGKINHASLNLKSKVNLRSAYNIHFILPSYGFLFITSGTVFDSQRRQVNNLIKKEMNSFFVLADLKNFMVSKYNEISNDYNQFFNSSPLVSRDRYSLVTFTERTTSLNFLVKQYGLEYDETKYEDTLSVRNYDPRIPRIRFKPGHSRIWRRARAGIKEYFEVRFRYQRRLTRFLPHFYSASHIVLHKARELQLGSLLLASLFAPDMKTAVEFLDSGLIYLNGVVVSNEKIFLVKHDLLQMLVSFKYYILFKWLTNWERTKSTHLNRLAYVSRLKTKRTFRKRLPNWVVRRVSYGYDIPKYLEVDYLTLSAFILYEPFLSSDFNHLFQKFSRGNIYKNYNWKYIT